MNPHTHPSLKNTPIVALHWFRRGLRLHDNPALVTSINRAKSCPTGKGKFYAIYVLDGDSYQLRHCSALRANFLVECLQDLDKSLRSLGSRLYVAKGDPGKVLPKFWKEFGVTHMTFDYDETGEPYAIERDENVMKQAKINQLTVEGFTSETLFPLGKIGGYVGRVGGNPFSVPTSMSSFQSLIAQMGPIPKSLPTPKKTQFPDQTHNQNIYLIPQHPTDLPWPRSTPHSQVTPIWGQKDCENLTPLVRGGEKQALQQLANSITARPSFCASFSKPSTSPTALTPSTTSLSPYLANGCLSVKLMWETVTDTIKKAPKSCERTKPPVSLHGQILWREFNYLMAHCANQIQPGSWGKMKGNPYCREVKWAKNEEKLKAWKEGNTGYPWIDACMTQLRTQGWIHHLGRHAVACFLTRGDLWQSWEEGALYFESQLLDADYAINNFNWLWLSCSGFFYQFFRCYSPIGFQRGNDPSGVYIRKWLPLLESLPDKYIYEPWKAPKEIQTQTGIVVGENYPPPIVDHAVVSKENIDRMSVAYKVHKEKQAKGKGKKRGREEDLSVKEEGEKVGGMDPPLLLSLFFISSLTLSVVPSLSYFMPSTCGWFGGKKEEEVAEEMQEGVEEEEGQEEHES